MGFEHVIPQFSLRASEAISRVPSGPIPFEIQGDGSQTRAFIHVDDFTDGLATVIYEGRHLEIYNIGNPEEVTIRHLAEAVVGSLGREASVVEGEPVPGATKRRCPDIGKLRALGFEPKIELQQGLPSVVRWYVQHGTEV